MSSRFRSFDETLADFGGEALVACPRCSERARVRVREPGADPRVLLSCPHCGHSRGWEPTSPGVMTTSRASAVPRGQMAFGIAADPFFHLPLWLQAPCCGERLWALNAAHLEWLEGYVGATLRERSPGEHGWSNRAMASRLPRWMQSAKNRGELLRCIRALKEKA
jgi:hypothetical protein